VTSIPVESVAEIPGYSTPEGAIAAAKGHALQPKARRDAACFTGRQFLDAWSDLGQWVIEFSGPLWLRVFPAGNFINWAVEDAKPDVVAVAGPAVLEWKSGARQRVDPVSLALQRRGAEFWQFWVNDAGFHVYLRGRLILCFTPVRRRDTGEPLLHVWEDD
jgi:hypothetical protein